MNAKVRGWIEKDGVKFLREIGIKKDQTVLDFGCGEGHYTIPASRVVGRCGKIYALDKDWQVLDKLRQLANEKDIKNIEFINKTSKTNLGDNSVDVVLCYDVIHYQNKKKRIAVYNEIHRVLKKKGLFSVYPKHHKEDYPLMELAGVNLGKVIEEIEELGFVLEYKFLKRLLHDEYYNKGYILNFRSYKGGLRMIEVEKKSAGEFLVIVGGGNSNTEHSVELDDEYYQRLTRGKMTEEELIKKSFEFLLEKESKESILSRFNLKVIKRYFPEYEEEIKKQ